MTDLSTGTYASQSAAPHDAGKATQVAAQSKEAAGQAAAQVKDTVKEQAQRVGGEAKWSSALILRGLVQGFQVGEVEVAGAVEGVLGGADRLAVG